MQTIPLDLHATRHSLEALRQGHLLGIVADHVFGEPGIEVAFFDRTITVPRGPAVLSLRSRTPIIPAFMIRETPWHFRLFLETPIWAAEDADRKAAVTRLTRDYVRLIERYVTRFPTQWLMFQPLLQRGATPDVPNPAHANDLVRNYPRI